MAFEITKTFTIAAPSGAVWEFLVDPQRVARCLPGAAVTDRLDDKTWAGTMTVKVGPVQSSYKGKVVFEKLDAAAHSAEIVASGLDVKGRGGADLRLTSTLQEKGPRETEVTTVSRVNITGILAQMGRGMVQDVSDQMFKVFSERMRAELEAAAPAPQPAAPQPAAVSPVTPAPVPPVAPAPSLLGAGPVAPSPVPAPAQAAPRAPAVPTRAEALDLGSLGARVLVRRPGFWVAVAVVAVVLALLLR